MELLIAISIHGNTNITMNIHEYQAKELFDKAGIPVSLGVVITKAEQIDDALSGFGENDTVVVKAQIHAGGRGKGTFTDGYKGGVKVVSSKAAAKEAALKMLGNTLVTKQTGEAGRMVQTIYLCADVSIASELYLAVVMDRDTSQPVVIASTEGGVEIEDVAENSPEKIVKCFVDPTLGLLPFQAREISFGLGFSGDLLKQSVKLLMNLYKMFWETDCSQVEINPLVITGDDKLVALDAKVNFDDNALYRHPGIEALRDLNEEDEKETEAAKFNLNYIALDGNIACMVNGAGLAMATMDIIKHFGGSPANFLDVGGGATEEQVTAAFKIILKDPKVKGVLVNIFGGIMKCDIIAAGIVEAAKNVKISVPLVVRLEGTNVEEGRKILKDSGLELNPADSLSDAAKKMVELAAK